MVVACMGQKRYYLFINCRGGINMAGTIEQAIIRLRNNPQRTVRARLDHMEVEIRVVSMGVRPKKLGDHLASIGPWSGESPEEISRTLADARKTSGTAEPPVF